MNRRKVSMVMPCYNKELYIGAMLHSVHSQTWDNIELILVNDGSTDGTPDIIANWEPKLHQRGYEVIVINQENSGVAMAVKNGLSHITGDYVCIVDCDDELYPDYVSSMAEYLDANPRHDWCICDYDANFMERGIISAPAEHNSDKADMSALTLEDFALDNFSRAVWRFFLRSSCLKKLKITENIPQTEQRITHEAYIVMPLIAFGNYGHVNKPLYKYRLEIPAITNIDSFEKKTYYLSTYFESIKYTLGTIPISRREKLRILALSELHRDFMIMQGAFNLATDMQTIKQAATNMEQCVNRHFTFCGDTPILNSGRLERLFTGARLPTELLINAIRYAVKYSDYTVKPEPCFKLNRVVGYGAKGAVATRLVPRLADSLIKPSVLWDKNAREGDELCGISITKPEFKTLSDDDTLLIFPKSEEIIAEVKESLHHAGIKCQVFCFDDMKKLPMLYFPQFYGDCKFSPPY